MKAIVYTQYGPPEVLQLKEVAKPEPKEHQVLVKVHAASVNALDYRRFEKISFMGRLMEERFTKSVGKVLGADIAGVVEAVGANVKQFQLGDEVFGVTTVSGVVMDQADRPGLIRRLQGLGIVLISIIGREPDDLAVSQEKQYG